MIRRPYSNLSVVELEKLFQRSRTDEEVLAGLLAELSQRSTNRAARLRASVLEAGEAAQKIAGARGADAGGGHGIG
jgi:hypothetical protein